MAMRPGVSTDSSNCELRPAVILHKNQKPRQIRPCPSLLRKETEKETVYISRCLTVLKEGKGRRRRRRQKRIAPCVSAMSLLV